MMINLVFLEYTTIMHRIPADRHSAASSWFILFCVLKPLLKTGNALDKQRSTTQLWRVMGKITHDDLCHATRRK